MIDLFTEELIPLKQAAKLLPNRPHLATLYRWCDGVEVTPRHKRGEKAGPKVRVQLESVCIGGQDRWTSKQAVQRFVEAYTRARDGKPATLPIRATRQRQQDVKDAQQRLKAAGIARA